MFCECFSKMSSSAFHIDTSGGLFPDMSADLQYFNDAFDKQIAEREGFIIPKPGVNPAYDEASEREKIVKGSLQRYLEDVQQDRGDRSIQYVHKMKERYQIQISIAAINKMPVPCKLVILLVHADVACFAAHLVCYAPFCYLCVCVCVCISYIHSDVFY